RARAAQASPRRTRGLIAGASRAPPEGQGPSGALRLYEWLTQLGRYADRPTALAVDHHLDRRDVGTVQAIGAVDRVLERPRRMADLADTDLDVVLVVETQGRLVAHTRFADREVDAMREHVAVVHDAQLAQVRDASDLREQQIVRVVDDPLQVRLSKTHSLAMRKRKIHGRLAG